MRVTEIEDGDSRNAAKSHEDSTAGLHPRWERPQAVALFPTRPTIATPAALVPTAKCIFTPDEDGTYYVAAGSYLSGYRDEDVGTYTVQVSIDDFRDDTDTTGTVEVGGSVTGEIEAQGDTDWFAVILEAGKTYQVDMEGSATDRAERWQIRFFTVYATPMVTGL